MAKTILGLDLGCSSIGWALLSEPDESKGEIKGRILRAGVRVFPEGVDRDTKGLEKSKTVQRREARGVRKTHRRRRLRKQLLVEKLREVGLLPPTEQELLNLIRSTDPYQLRAKALDHALSPYELGRVLYHLAQRRGFKSNRKGTKKSEDGPVLKGISELACRIQENTCRTLGEYLFKASTGGIRDTGDAPWPVRIRGPYTERKMYMEEFDAIWDVQKQAHPDVLTDALRKSIRDEILFFQRPLKSAEHLVGFCDLEPEERRCPRDRWEAQQFVAVQEINNLRRIDIETGELAFLTSEERDILLDQLAWAKQITTERAYRLLGWPDSSQFNMDIAKRKYLKGNAVGAAISKSLGNKEARALSQDQIVRIGALLSEEEDEGRLAETLKENFGFSDEQVAGFLQNAAQLPEAYLSVSLKAITRLMPHLNEGKVFSDAKEAAGYQRSDQLWGEDLNRLPLPWDFKREVPVTNNPVVQKALHEIRKVVNALIKQVCEESGNPNWKPDEIVIEMAREAQGSIAQRNERNIEMRKRERKRKEWAEIIEKDLNIPLPTRQDILKYELWLESGKVCPYTGRPISAGQLFRGEVQIDHILPYSRSLDDSFMNKVLSFVGFNARKGNLTPYEYFSQTTDHQEKDRWEAILKWVRDQKDVPWAKRRRFIQKEIDTDACIQRQLNDTRYISRLVRSYVARLAPKDRHPFQYVRCSRGDMTAQLRRDWGLEAILGKDRKNRDDHRHHAVDAVVVALTNHKRIWALASLAKEQAFRRQERRASLPEPWPNFWEEARQVIAGIIVSHKSTRRIRGQLHEETFYGPTSEPTTFAVRRPVDQLTASMLDKIIDPVVRARVKETATISGDKVKFVTAPTMPSGVPIKKVRIHVEGTTMIPLKPATEPKKYVKPGENHHIAIYVINKGDEKEYEEDVVSMLKAARRKARGEEIVPHTLAGRPGSKLLFSLCKNDLVAIPEGDSLSYYRVAKFSSGQSIHLRPHYFAGKAGDISNRLLKAAIPLVKMGAYKITIDPIGRLCRGND